MKSTKKIQKNKLIKSSERHTISEKMIISFILIIFIIAIFSLIYASKSLLFKKKNNENFDNQAIMEPKLSRMSFTSFDSQLARKLMDKDNDGSCDSCGMPVEMCIDSGELECTMGNSKSTIGKLGSQHIHADWKIYINNDPYDFALIGDRHERQMRGDQTILDTSAFIHIHPGQLPEKTGDALHMHAKGVPLWIFFESLGMEFNKDCLVLPAKERFCNDDKNILKFFVNGQTNDQYEKYVFKDLDKILISYGPKDEDVTQQLNSITNFAGEH